MASINMTLNSNTSLPVISPVTRLSPAKINLFLHITGKREDGYHDLQTVFRLLDWGDYMHFLPTELLNINKSFRAKADAQLQVTDLCSKLITLTGADSITDNLEDNLIFKSARILLSHAILANRLPEHLQKISITLDKRLPMGAGLGGGSSNAATTLLALNEIWQFNLNYDDLIKIATTIGADVPIFIFGQDAIAMGIGEDLTPVNLPDQHYLILTPNAHANTAELFAHSKLCRDTSPLLIKTIKSQTEDYCQNLNAPYHNAFTPVVTSLLPTVNDALQYLHDLEKIARGTARMTGSGSAVFLPIDNRIALNTTLLSDWIANAPCPAYVVQNLKA